MVVRRLGGHDMFTVVIQVACKMVRHGLGWLVRGCCSVIALIFQVVAMVFLSGCCIFHGVR